MKRLRSNGEIYIALLVGFSKLMWVFVTFVKVNEASLSIFLLTVQSSIEHLLSESLRLLHLFHIYVWRVISLLGETTGQVLVEVEDERAIISLLMA